MTAKRLLLAVLLVVPMAVASVHSREAPTTRPAEERADRALNDQLNKLEAEYRAKKAEILRRHASQLVVAKNEAIKAGDRQEAQRIFEKIADVNAKVAELVPPPPPATRPAVTFSLKLSDFNGAAGFTNTVLVTATNISVAAENDFGKPPKVIWEAKLTADQQGRLITFLRTFPLDRLGESYVDPNVFDGYQMFFTIQIGDAAARKITVANRRQRDLEQLIDAVNELLPPKHLLNKMSR